MRPLLFCIAGVFFTMTSFGQFADTSELNTYIRDTIRDRRPEKITAAQLQKAFLGTTKFLKTVPNFIAANGIAKSDTIFKLGGELTEETEILTSATNGYGISIKEEESGVDIFSANRPGTDSETGVEIQSLDQSGIFILNNSGVTLSSSDSVNIYGSDLNLNAGSGVGITGAGEVNLSSLLIKFKTNGTDRLIIDNGGAWDLGGNTGAAGQVLTSNGPGGTPTWEDTSIGGGTDGQMPFMNSGGTAFGYDADVRFQTTPNIFRAGANFTVTQNLGAINDLTMLGIGHSVVSSTASSGGVVRWTTLLGELNSMTTSSSGGIANSSILGGNSNVMSNTGSGAVFNAMILGGASSSMTASSTFGINSSLIFGRFNTMTTSALLESTIIMGYRSTASQAYAMAFGYKASATGLGSIAFGGNTNMAGANNSAFPMILSAGLHSFNCSTNSTAQTSGHGALSDYSAILGGLDANIPSTSPGSVILGGNGIKARASEADQVYVPNLNIAVKPINNDTINQVLVRDYITGKVKYRNASSFGGGGWPLTGSQDLTGNVNINGDGNTVTLGDPGALWQFNVFALDLISFNSEAAINFAADNGMNFTSFNNFNIEAVNDIAFRTNSTARLTIDNDGAWDLGGDKGIVGQKLTSNGTGAAPTWEDPDWKTVTFTVPSASVLTGNSVPYELLPAPGANKYIAIQSGFVSIDYAGTPYAANTNVFVRVGATTVSGAVTSFLNTTADRVGNATFQSSDWPINQNVNFFVQSGDPTGGNSDVKVTLTYKILDL